MNILLWVVLGALAGWIASVISGRHQQGLLTDILLGILGAIAGGYAMNFIGQPGITGFNIYSILVAVIGATILIWIGRLLYR